MSSSSQSSSANAPEQAEIEQVLRQVVREALKNDEEITVNLARTRAESRLGLKADFLRSTGDWKQQSKDIINAAVEDPPSPQKASKVASKARPAKQAKRKSENLQPVRKRQRKGAVVVESDEEEISDPGSDIDHSVKTPGDRSMLVVSKGNRKPTVGSGSESSDLSDLPIEDVEPKTSKPNDKPDDGDESDMSSLIDDPPPKKRRQKKESASDIKSKSRASNKSATANKSKAGVKELSPDDEEIKRLQGWLLKCGIRKLWHRELAPYDTAKEKIRHLKQMLTDVGMTGRFSVEKAKQIKETRELAAELEAAQEFNEQWGHSGSEDDNDNDKGHARPRRAAPKGLVDFGDSGDESD